MLGDKKTKLPDNSRHSCPRGRLPGSPLPLASAFMPQQSTLYMHAPVEQANLGHPPFHTWGAPGEAPWCEFYREERSYRMRFPGLADFKIRSAGATECYPTPGVTDATLRHLHLNQVVPAILSLQGRAVYHGSCVDMGGSALAFLGMSGRGKSTLVTYLCLHGGRLITDDALELEWDKDRPHAVPSHPSVRLWDDSRDALLPEDATTTLPPSFTTKERFAAENLFPLASLPVVLRRAYFLGDGSSDTIAISPLGAADAHMHWVQNSFLPDPHDKERISLHFQQVSRLALVGLGYRLDYPRRYESLEAVRDAVLEHASR